MDAVKKIFYKGNIVGFDKFVDECRSAGIKISEAKLKDFYDNQEITQMFRPLPKGTGGKKMLVFNPFEKVYMDAMYITSSGVSLITTVDYFTKYGGVRVVKKKSVDSMDSLLALEDYENKIVDYGYLVVNVYSDNGSEFKGAFNKYLKEVEINHVFTDANDKRQTSPIESFNRTIRLALEKKKAMGGVDATNIVEVVKKVVDDYNNTVHSSTGYSPNELLKNESKQNEFYNKQKELQNDYGREQEIKKGALVRLPLEKSVFDKLQPTWSKKLYKVSGYKNGRYTVEGVNKKYPWYYLQVVDYDKLQGSKEKLARVENEKLMKNIEGLPTELSGLISSFVPSEKEKKKEEPTVEKRQTRGVKVNYKELAGVKERKSKS